MEFLDDGETVSSSPEFGVSSVNGDNSTIIDSDSLRSVLDGDGGFTTNIGPGFAFAILVKRGGDVVGQSLAGGDGLGEGNSGVASAGAVSVSGDLDTLDGLFAVDSRLDSNHVNASTGHGLRRVGSELTSGLVNLEERSLRSNRRNLEFLSARAHILGRIVSLENRLRLGLSNLQGHGEEAGVDGACRRSDSEVHLLSLSLTVDGGPGDGNIVLAWLGSSGRRDSELSSLGVEVDEGSLGGNHHLDGVLHALGVEVSHLSTLVHHNRSHCRSGSGSRISNEGESSVRESASARLFLAFNLYLNLNDLLFVVLVFLEDRAFNLGRFGISRRLHSDLAGLIIKSDEVGLGVASHIELVSNTLSLDSSDNRGDGLDSLLADEVLLLGASGVTNLE